MVIFGSRDHLIHSLEAVHFTMFGTMMCLLVETLYLIWLSHLQCAEWERTNDQAEDDIDEIIHDYNAAENSCCSRMCGSRAHKAMRFASFRHRFIHSDDAKKLKIPHNFEFNECATQFWHFTLADHQLFSGLLLSSDFVVRTCLLLLSAPLRHCLLSALVRPNVKPPLCPRYVEVVAGETIGECVEIPLSSWFAILFVAIVFWAITRQMTYLENFTIA